MSHSVSWGAVGFLLAALLVPIPAPAAETTVGMVFTNGPAWLNGSAVPNSAAVFSGDILQTGGTSSARINATGVNVLVSSNTLVKVDVSKIGMERGTVNVGTSRGLATEAGDVIVTPKEDSWTEFQVSHVDGRVQIVAQKGDLTVTDGQSTSTVSQGQQTTIDDTNETNKKKHRKRGEGAVPAARGSILSSKPAVLGGMAIIGGVTAWVLLQSEEPLSPSCPSPGSCP